MRGTERGQISKHDDIKSLPRCQPRLSLLLPPLHYTLENAAPTLLGKLVKAPYNVVLFKCVLKLAKRLFLGFVLKVCFIRSITCLCFWIIALKLLNKYFVLKHDFCQFYIPHVTVMISFAISPYHHCQR